MATTFLEVWKKKGKILEGIKNSVFKNEHVEEIATQRDKICQSCNDIDRTGSKCFAPGTQPCCGICGCSLKFLQRSLASECEAGHWKAVLTQEEADELENKLDEDGN